MKRIAVTGAAGQIAYSLLFRIAAGQMLRKDQTLALHLLERPEVLSALEGVKMELEDCAFPLLKEVRIGSDPHQVFEGVHYALLVGAKPRGPNMERADLLMDNAKIFVAQGQALNAVAERDVKVLVVGNPCNTNCLIAMSHAPDLPKENFFSMMRLDQNRAMAQLASKAKVEVSQVRRVAVWGNHSLTQVPDYFNATIRQQPALEMITDQSWLEQVFLPKVQKRGAEIIAARGKSSAASAASAAIDSIRSLVSATAADDWFSLGVYTANNSYGIDNDLFFSFPCRSSGNGDYEIVKGVPWNERLQEMIRKTEQELIEERQAVASMLP